MHISMPRRVEEISLCRVGCFLVGQQGKRWRNSPGKRYSYLKKKNVTHLQQGLCSAMDLHARHCWDPQLSQDPLGTIKIRMTSKVSISALRSGAHADSVRLANCSWWFHLFQNQEQSLKVLAQEPLLPAQAIREAVNLAKMWKDARLQEETFFSTSAQYHQR